MIAKAIKMVTYKVQIHPSQSIADYVSARKTEILETCGQYNFYNSRPEITLFSFQADISNEVLITKALTEATGFVDFFDISLNGFSYFNQNRAVYLKVENASQLASAKKVLWQKFKEAAKGFGVRLVSPVSPRLPYMMIGSGFEQKAFLKVHQSFIDQKYAEAFRPEALHFVRDIGNGKNDLVHMISVAENSALSLKWPEEKVWMVNEPQMTLFSYVA